VTPAEALAAVDPALGALISRVGPIKLSRPDNPEPYAALMHSIAHQQLHGRAAEAILGRLRAHHGGTMPAPEFLLAMEDTALRGCGFSGGKILALRDIALKAMNGVIPTRAQARRLSDEALIERLTTIRGVGRWTVEMLLIFSLNRKDVFPVDDFGVREGYRLIHKLSAQPKPKAFALLGQAYAPHRSLAARYLWKAADLKGK
jgi:DNA-3-methyladenine glycosylase II